MRLTGRAKPERGGLLASVAGQQGSLLLGVNASHPCCRGGENVDTLEVKRFFFFVFFLAAAFRAHLNARCPAVVSDSHGLSGC